MRGLLGCLLLLAGCIHTGGIPSRPKPIPELNTEWDDYNLAPTPLRHFVWSTNRGSRGNDFDIWTASGDFEGRKFVFEHSPRRVDRLSSQGNEFGPVYPVPEFGNSSTRVAVFNSGVPPTLVFASDRPGGAGGLDLYRAAASGIEPLEHLNSPGNDAYWSGYARHDGWVSGAVLFASDRGGKGYDIYAVSWTGGAPRPFGGAGASIEPVAELNSDADDSAPFIVWNWRDEAPAVLFASNRAGGEGGFDLYASRYVAGRWTKPHNLGRRYNTPYDEYRPSDHGAQMIFSSNRPGGKGGYDLYRVKFPELVED